MSIGRFKIPIPAIVAFALSALGGTKWLRDKAFHVPEAALPSAADQAGVTPQQWRSVEAVQVQLVTDGIVLKTVPKNP